MSPKVINVEANVGDVIQVNVVEAGGGTGGGGGEDATKLWEKRWNFRNGSRCVASPADQGWEQEPNKVWFNIHRQRPASVSQTCYIQGDTDISNPRSTSPWPESFPSTAKVWVTFTPDNRNVDFLRFGLETQQHITDGSETFRIKDTDAGEVRLLWEHGSLSVPINPETRDDPPTVVVLDVPVPGGMLGEELTVEIEITLGSPADGGIYGDIWVAGYTN